MKAAEESVTKNPETPVLADRKRRKSDSPNGANGSKLPRGIRIGFREGRPKPYFVRYGSPRKIESFATKKERDKKAAELAEGSGSQGRNILNFTPGKWRRFLEWEAKYGKESPKVAKAVHDYMALRLAEDIAEKSDTHVHMKTRLEKRFSAHFGDFTLDQITADDLRDWLESLTDPRHENAPLSKVSLRHYRKDVHTFYKRAILEGWVKENPCDAVKPPKVRVVAPVPLTPRQIFALLKANQARPVIGRLVLELFGGLRCSSAEAVKLKDIRFEERGIYIQQHKSGAPKYREGHPDVLWAWLAVTPEKCWKMSPQYYDTAKAIAFTEFAGFDNPGNSLRHSFASYYLALKKSYQPVMYLMQHSRVSTTQIYEGIAREADARLVFAMTPQAVSGTYEEFLSSQPPKNP